MSCSCTLHTLTNSNSIPRAFLRNLQVLDSKGHLVDDTPQAITEFLTDSRRKKITRIVDSYIDRFAGEGQRPGSPGAHAKDRRAILAI